MTKKIIINDVTIETELELSLEELCLSCQVTSDFISELVEYGAIEPLKISMESWRFDATALRRIRAILRLQRDLEVNLSGAALVLDLMDEIEKLRAQVEFLEKQSRE